jgi:hypothetical protein
MRSKKGKKNKKGSSTDKLGWPGRLNPQSCLLNPDKLKTIADAQQAHLAQQDAGLRNQDSVERSHHN